ncbi:thioredoxin-disulfide reductase [Methylobacterium sp. J-043]|uniref:thioredoxin-disulfide reductase n=1 Tax=Methylorubrum TaxID=2282523 RepID=UPI00209EDEEC|nr:MULTISPECIES: thioredoxin-disulfide reductase [Methylorubrum]MCJ2030412.1 thioredoxin-disulfide reductase [Methylobacterium sp. J-043]MCP1547093.1 thioredoxin reductase (NADPH) [Methylorubrum zatmanii]MCP1556291.1 thioredoxin reductase (NADPH) [Methylorubrum extorquens]MCP1577396.1 thioredoxin reductase (NADPH) [Methylorubrum extorquens]
MAHTHARLVIIGSGPAGYTAAIYAARAMVEPLLISGFQPGGQLMITTDVENYPGFADAIQGPWLMEQMRLQAEHVGTKIVSEYITSVDLNVRPFRLEADSGETYTCDALIIATGAQAKWLGLPSEAKFQGFGVSACATCDGFFFRGKDVTVVGGGNTAVEEALYLANLAKSVTVIHRRGEFRAERILQERLFKHANVTVKWHHAVEEICGSDTPPSVTHLRLKDLRSGAIVEQPTDGLFVAIGHQPATGIFEGQLPMRHGGYITVTPGTTETEIPGVFAAGDVTDDVYRQAITAAGMGCMAALEAEKFLANLDVGESPAKAAAE